MLCPICKKPVDASSPDAKRFHPFCSERCRLVDLGRWLGEKYQIPLGSESGPSDDTIVSPAPLRND